MRTTRCRQIGLLAALIALPIAACGTGTKQKLTKTAFESESERAEWFEATLRVLDENPEWVDEFYTHARKHPATVDRFTRNSIADMDHAAFAKMAAGHLAHNPASLREILIQTLDAADSRKEARDAVARAIEERIEPTTRILAENPELVRRTMVSTLDRAKDAPPAAQAIDRAIAERVAVAADIITDDPELVSAIMVETIEKVRAKPAARAAFVRAMYQTSPELARILANNPALLTHMMKAIAKQAGRDPKLVKDVIGNVHESAK